MIRILKEAARLLLTYEADGFNDPGWVGEKLSKEGSVTFRRTFTFSPDTVVTDADANREDTHAFLLGVAEDSFYKIDRNILGLKHDLLIDRSMSLSDRIFVANRDISIFRRIDELVDEQIVVGGDSDNAIPLAEFEMLLVNFPTTTELTHYARSRITRVLKDYFGTMSDAQKKMNTYLEQRRTIHPKSKILSLQDFEVQKFEFVRDELIEMLRDDESYSEKDWQNSIVDLLLLVFPKYIAVLDNVHVKDFYSDPAKTRNRYIDLVLVDANGTIDIIEIKKPFENCLLSQGKYRGNYTPRTELAGAVMQAEKYLFHLVKWGRDGERRIFSQHKAKLPKDFLLRVTNPKATIILGRDRNFSDDQRFDFEVIRRKYANVIDIMTYDDLLRRLENIIAMIRPKFSRLGSHS